MWREPEYFIYYLLMNHSSVGVANICSRIEKYFERKYRPCWKPRFKKKCGLFVLFIYNAQIMWFI